MLISLLIKFDNASKATAEVGGCGHTDNVRGAGQKYKNTLKLGGGGAAGGAAAPRGSRWTLLGQKREDN